MARRYEQYKVERGNNLGDPEFWNQRLEDIDLRLGLREADGYRIETALDEVEAAAVTRIDVLVGPAAERIRKIAELGFLVAYSSSSATLAVGDVLAIVISADDDRRELFTPSPITLLSRVANVDDYAVVRTVSYERAGGSYTFEVMAVAGDPGPHDDWVIAAVAGSTLAQLAMLNTALSIQSDVTDKRGEAVAAAAIATEMAGDATDARDEINAKFRVSTTTPPDGVAGQIWLKPSA